MTQLSSRRPRVDVVGTSTQQTSRGWRAVRDGQVFNTVGLMVVGGFGVEVAKSYAANETAGRVWLIAGLLAGIVLLAVAWLLRRRFRRNTRVAIVVVAPDARRGMARAAQLTQQAETFAQATCSVTLKAEIPTPEGERPTTGLITQLADETLAAMSLAERLSPDATRFNLIPTMPLHAAFRFGLRLGHTHARDVRVYQVRQGNGDQAYFEATSLRMMGRRRSPLNVRPIIFLPNGDPATAALALDLQCRGEAFVEAVKAACLDRRIGHILVLQSSKQTLRENFATFSDVVAQTVREWRAAALPSAARTGSHTIFLSGPVSVSLGLGALLAAEAGSWLALTFDPETSRYEELPQETIRN